MRLNQYLNAILMSLVLYCLLFVGLHFINPSIPDISIKVLPNSSNSELQQVTISLSESPHSYYLVIFEDSFDEQWLYFSSSNYSSSITPIIEHFNQPKNKYLVFEGNKTLKEITFVVKAKYDLNQMLINQHLFHVYYIVPYHLLPSSNFYYSEHRHFFLYPSFK